MSRITEILRAAIKKKETNISQIAKQAEVERTFLNRLVQGAPPRLRRSGPREDASAYKDDRYHRIALALDLNPETFLLAIHRAQHGSDLLIPDDFKSRHNEFWPLVKKSLIDGRPNLHALLRNCMSKKSLLPNIQSRILKTTNLARKEIQAENPKPLPYKRREDFLGTPPGFETASTLKSEARECLRISHALIGLDSLENIADRIAISTFFSELAPVLNNETTNNKHHN